MAHSRNTDGIRAAAQRKRVAAQERTNAAIRTLVKAGKPINFTSVAEAAGVSTAWLYEEPDIKARIQQLRDQGTVKAKSSQAKSRLSDGSKDAIIATLKGRIKTLEQRNRELSQQNEVFGGQVLRVHELEQQVKRLETDHAKLPLQQGHLEQPCPRMIGEIEAQLVKRGVNLNSTIQMLLTTAPVEAIRSAMASLEEALLAQRVTNPSGFFHAAVTRLWQPNEPCKFNSEPDLFKDWYKLAKAKGIVQASMLVEGIQHVMTLEDTWVPFTEIVVQYPVEGLRLN